MWIWWIVGRWVAKSQAFGHYPPFDFLTPIMAYGKRNVINNLFSLIEFFWIIQYMFSPHWKCMCKEGIWDFCETRARPGSNQDQEKHFQSPFAYGTSSPPRIENTCARDWRFFWNLVSPHSNPDKKPSISSCIWYIYSSTIHTKCALCCNEISEILVKQNSDTSSRIPGKKDERERERER
jgi:hypothetical protein